MFNRKEKKSLKLQEKARKKINKNTEKVNNKIISELQGKFGADEFVQDIVSYKNKNMYILRTSKDRIFFKGIKGLNINESVTTIDKIQGVSKRGTSIYLEQQSGETLIFQVNDLNVINILYDTTLNLVKH